MDWCEANYTVTPHIAEFVNTISNAVFLLVPAVFLNLWSSYSRKVTRGIHVVWLFFGIVGICSAYFHATLSLLGQLLDEISILWLWMYTYTLISPVHLRPKFLRERENLFTFFTTVVTGVLTAMSFVAPYVNSFALFLLLVPSIIFLAIELRAAKNPRIVRLGFISLMIMAFGVMSWACDRFLCGIWQTLNLTVLHGVWHVLVFSASYIVVTLFCYFHASRDVPKSKPMLRFWPKQFWGVPYVYCKSDYNRKMP